MNHENVGGSHATVKRRCIALIAFIILSAIGSVITVELTDVWVRTRMDPDFQSFCAVSEGMNCETVALSDYSTFLGGPVSVWATAGFLFIALLSVLSLVRVRDGYGRGYLFLFSVLFGVVSLLLVYVMSVLIKSMCILCLAVDVVNFGLLAMAVLGIKMTGDSIVGAIRYDLESIWRRPLLVVLTAVAGVGLLSGAYLYGQQLAVEEGFLFQHNGSAPQVDDSKLDSPEQWTSKLSRECGEECPCEGQGHHQTNMGVDEAGHPWIGAETGSLTIQEFTDYECPYCRKAHMMVRKLLSNHPGKIRVYHRHYPLDAACNPRVPRPFHRRACELSRIAECAGRQGRFWEMNDFLFQHAKEIRRENLSAADIAGRLELDANEFQCCMDNEDEMAIITEDIKEGMELKLKGTPAFLVNGKIYYGKIPDEAVSELER